MKTYVKTLLLIYLIIPLKGYSNEDSMNDSLWRVGNSWIVKIKLYTNPSVFSVSTSNTRNEQEKLEPYAVYNMKIEVVGAEKIDSTEYWKISFTPDNTAPKGVKGQAYQIMVNKKTMQVSKITRIAGDVIRNPSIEKIDSNSFIINAPYGFPIEIFSLVEKKSNKILKGQNGITIEYKSNIINSESILELKIKLRTEEYKIIQRNKQGKNWWSTYEKYQDGYIILKAEIL